MNKEKKWVIFDAMGVIFEVGDDTNDLLVPYVQSIDSNLDSKIINEIYLKASLGEINSDEFWRGLGLHKKKEQINLDQHYLDSCLTLDKEFVNVAKRLKKQYNLAIVSNDVKEWSSYLRNKFNLNDLVCFSAISGDVGVRKPNEEIYKIALERSGALPSECVYIDDRDKNLIPAQKLGMKVIRFEREGEVKTKLLDVEKINSFLQLEEVLNRLF